MLSPRAFWLLPLCFAVLTVYSISGSGRRQHISDGDSLLQEDVEKLAEVVSPPDESAKLTLLRAIQSSDRLHLGSSRRRLLEHEVVPEDNTTRVLEGTHCGCQSCTNAIWNSPAPSDAGPNFSCGNRIKYVMSQGTSEAKACRTVAGEFPDICGACNPDKCTLDSDNDTTSPTELYCFRPSSKRKRWSGVWNGQFDVEVKSSDTPCGPSKNLFSDDAVSLTNNQLTLQFKKLNGVWVGSEVRVLLPKKRQPFSYGTFKFSVKSVSMIDLSTGQSFRKYLPGDLVIGMYSWNPLENYAIRENYNHEVDIEIAKFKNQKQDGNFIIQPPDESNRYRFHTGSKTKPNPGDKTYEFTWSPTSMYWKTSAKGGISYSYTTQMALDAGKKDHIQCLPTALELRLNLWHLQGTNQPSTMLDNHMAQVVIDNFSYTPSNIVGVDNGEVCSKDCQCLPSSRCIKNRCVKKKK